MIIFVCEYCSEQLRNDIQDYDLITLNTEFVMNLVTVLTINLKYYSVYDIVKRKDNVGSNYLQKHCYHFIDKITLNLIFYLINHFCGVQKTIF